MSTPFAFSPEQTDNMRAALRALHERRGDWQAVSSAVGVSVTTLQRFLRKVEHGSPTMAFRIALANHQPVDEVVNGAPHGRCPTCQAALRRPLDPHAFWPSDEEGSV